MIDLGNGSRYGLFLLPAILLGGFATLFPGFASMNALALANGHWWTLWTGHFLHWTTGHLIWDWSLFMICLMFLAKGGWRVWGWIVVGLPILGIGIWLARPEMWEYRGLSGIDTVLFVRVAMGFYGYRKWLPLSGLGLKIAYEFLTVQTIFSGDLGRNNVPVPEIHMMGLFFGLIWCWASNRNHVTDRQHEHLIPSKSIPAEA
ncbi:MAG: hypothetical protein AAGJ81_07775 [Verrucomicrobiota bacterium]